MAQISHAVGSNTALATSASGNIQGRPSHPQTPSRGTKKTSAKTKPSLQAATTLQSQSTKPKQTKSRNGCATCKEKRLKCDETKPTCDQCAKRGVQCAGYRKNFQWKPFEEQPIGQRAITGVTKQRPTTAKRPSSVSHQVYQNEPTIQEHKSRNSPQSAAAISEPVRTQQVEQTPHKVQSIEIPSLPEGFANNENVDAVANSMPHDDITALDFGALPDIDPQHPGLVGFSDEWRQPETFQMIDDSAEFLSNPPMTLPLINFGKGFSTHATGAASTAMDFESSNQGAIASEWISPAANPMPKDMLTGQSCIDNWGNTFDQPFASHKAIGWLDNPSPPPPPPPPPFNLCSQPRLSVDSQEQLLGKFLNETCGIMCIQTEPLKNPWWLLISPLINEHPALYHAVASMACFHQSKSIPELRQSGMQHVSQSVKELHKGSTKNNKSHEIIMATSIALAFSESWNTHTSTGIDHIKCAKEVMSMVVSDENALRRRNHAHLELLKFLCKTWLYIDVIARLTSMDADVSDDFEHVAMMLFSPLQKEVEVDPLMGCATTLFPIIGRVANLARQVCKGKDRKSPPAMTERAQKLKIALENWTPSSFFEDAANTSSRHFSYHHQYSSSSSGSSSSGSSRSTQSYEREIGNSLLTAEAYRWATMLHLHQAVPEVQGLPSPAELARRILNLLANVSPDSGTLIVQIYPLLVAGCEAASKEDRDWVVQRWKKMSNRMCIGNVDRCAEVVAEVWRRRDKHAPFSEDHVVVGGVDGDEDFMSLTDFGPDFLKQLATPQSGRSGLSSTTVPGSSGSLGQSPSPFLRSHAQSVSSGTTMGLDTSCSSGLAHDLTIRGRLHWVGVMRDWNWEVLLG